MAQVTTNPSPFEIDEQVTITIDANSSATNCNGFSNPNKIYAHLGVGDENDEYGIKVIGNWGQDDGVGEMAHNGDGTWSITFTPNSYFSLTPSEEANVTRMGMVFRNEDGSQEFKKDGCQNFVFNVGAFQISVFSPAPEDNGFIVVNNPGSTAIVAQTKDGSAANFSLSANGSVIDTQNNINFYFYQFNGITEIKSCTLVATQGDNTRTQSFFILPNGTISQNLPSSPPNLENGINYHSSDNTKATLVLDAPEKDFIYVVGSFNSYEPNSAYAMRKDPASGKFWLELSGLTSGAIETYQYWVADQTPFTDSPKVVKTADPYSTLVLSPFDDPWIPSTTYPNLPPYPSGQEREVTVLQTGQTPYNWQVTNFNKPKKEDLVIYEVLIRDFDSDRNFQDLIDKMDYFKNLNINAIELMPVMEFEGNESWGYNTVFHMALDKFYGTEDKFKEFIDTCHQNGIAVILDIALNHAFGRNPMVRMWMDDPDGDGWGGPSSENPYFNVTATHAYSVGSDFDHSNTRTKDYVYRVIKHWIEDFKIDGFRWDLTKGFTQECTSGDEGCTNGTPSDRVAILKDYVDYSWSLDETHYAIFEHLGADSEEKEWANYKLDEGKGVMMWSEEFNAYKNLAQGQSSDINISRVGHKGHSGFNDKRVIGYPESHDKDRLMYEMVTFGLSGIGGELNASLNRMSSMGAVFLTVPGPKMIWHFAELGMDNSIFTCTDGSVNTDYDAIDGDCKLDTKPQPQWTENWLGNTNRSAIYNDWSRLNYLKINEEVFEGDYNINTNSLTPRIHVFDNSLPGSSLKDVVIISNFSTTSQNVDPNFPYTGTWYDLMDETGNTSIEVNNTNSNISLQSGEFKIYGNTASTLSTSDIVYTDDLMLFPNPATRSFSINKSVETVSIFDTTGKLISRYEGKFQKNHKFNISNISQGLYIVNFKTQSASVSKRLLIN